MSQAIIPFDLIEIIMSFLAPRELFKLVFLSPFLMSRVTTEMVVRAALFRGGRAKKSFEELYRLIVQRAIHPPSPLRLLRIACATKCEVCLNTVVYRFNNKVNFVRKGFAINSCWRCTTKRRKSKAFRKDTVKYNNNRKVYDAIIDHERTSAKQYAWRKVLSEMRRYEYSRALRLDLNRRTVPLRPHPDDQNIMYSSFQVRDLLNYMWKTPLFDRTGERIGPVVTYDDVDNMASHLAQTLPHIDDSDYYGDKAMRDSYDNLMEAAIGSYIENVLQGQSADDQRYSDFITAYESAIIPAKAHLENLKWKRVTSSINWRMEKIHKCIDLVKQLNNQITDPRVRSVLVYQINDCMMKKKLGSKSLSPLCFRDLWVENIMLKYLVAPSKLNKKQINLLALKVTKKFFEEKEVEGRV